MRALPIAAASMLAFATPSLAIAQDASAEAPEEALSELSDTLADPQFQDQASAIAQVFVGAMLDLPVGPLAEAMGKATGGEGPKIDPDARVRDLAPEAEELPDQISDKLPMAMSALSAMAEGMQDMLPALRDMADRMTRAMDEQRELR
ncbi:MAG: hypothetical protein AAF250_09320 [Pseudomonadota bacterium]